MVKEIMKFKVNSMALVNVMTLWRVTSFPGLFNEICCKRRAKVGDYVSRNDRIRNHTRVMLY
jgi:hypothetical protein